jgi:hypothetical protein
MLLRLVFALAAVALVACSGGSNLPDAVTVTACNDTDDNDGDGLNDYPADPGCDSLADNDESNAPIAQCNDGRDNDGDTLADYPDDPGCFSPVQNSEVDDCPDGPECPACANGDDDDGDGQTDYPQDGGCMAASDDDEYVTNPAACGTGIIVTRLDGDTASDMFISGGQSVLMGSCGGVGSEVAYELVVMDPSVIMATTEDTATTGNTVMYVRDDCMDPSSEIACNDDIDPLVNRASALEISVQPGTYYLIIDNHDQITAGNFTLHVERFAGEGVPCTTTEECGPGLVCRTPLGGSEMVCADPVCADGLDDDADGTADYPGDPGCTSPNDTDESDDCPDGVNCPECGNGIDDDGDKLVDYPEDPDCTAASQAVEGCPTESDPFLTLTSATHNGDLVGKTNDFPLTCDNGGGNDEVYLTTVPAMQRIQFDTAGTSFDTVLALYASDCTSSLGCDDDGGSGVDSLLIMNNLPAGTYALVMAAYGTGTGGPYVLHTTGTIAPGGACDGPLATAGVISCDTGAGYVCNPTTNTCTGAFQCNNGIDDDGDGELGYPDEPGCANPTDDDETDDCPSGPTCPQCSNGIDDDGDLQTDYPMDTGCASAADQEFCAAESDPISPITAPTTSGTTVGATDDFIATCQMNTASPDVSYLLTLPVGVTSLAVDTNTSGWDTVLTLDGPDCATPLLACDDDSGTPGNESAFTATNLAAGDYIITVDGYLGASSPFQLHVAGVAVAGASCTSPLFAAGVLSCATGETCTAGTCQ